jgi:hypothetical protein
MRDVRPTAERADEVANALSEWLAAKRAALEGAGALRSPTMRRAWEATRNAIEETRDAYRGDEGAVVYLPRRAPKPEGE